MLTLEGLEVGNFAFFLCCTQPGNEVVEMRGSMVKFALPRTSFQNIIEMLIATFGGGECHSVTWVKDPSGGKDERILVGDQSIYVCMCK